jgi:hypothetical protein
MGTIIDLQARRTVRQSKPVVMAAKDKLPLVLSQLLAAGATDFARVALDAWGKQELDPEELLELCATYAAVAGLETV